MHLTLKLVNGEELEFHIAQKTCVIGRSAKCDVVVPHDGMSRQHCQISIENGALFVTDMGSTNGVWIDGEKIEPHTKTPYQTYLSLSFGAVQSLQVEVDESTGIINTPLKANNKDSDKNVSTPRENIPAPKVVKTKKEDKAKSMFVNLLAVVILAAAAWWYTHKEETPADTEQSSKSAPAQKTNEYDSF